MTVPVWLLDIDGVINAATLKPDPHVYPPGSWQEGHAVSNGRRWHIWWSRPVIDFINVVHASGRAEIRWHTTWQHEAQAVADLVGLPEFPVADAPEFLTGSQEAARARLEDRPEVWWKVGAAERVVLDEKRPLIWTDDDIGDGLARARHSIFHENDSVLLVCPPLRVGLTPRNLLGIGKFLDRHEARG